MGGGGGRWCTTRPPTLWLRRASAWCDSLQAGSTQLGSRAGWATLTLTAAGWPGASAMSTRTRRSFATSAADSTSAFLAGTLARPQPSLPGAWPRCKPSSTRTRSPHRPEEVWPTWRALSAFAASSWWARQADDFVHELQPRGACKERAHCTDDECGQTPPHNRG